MYYFYKNRNHTSFGIAFYFIRDFSGIVSDIFGGNKFLAQGCISFLNNGTLRVFDLVGQFIQVQLVLGNEYDEIVLAFHFIQCERRVGRRHEHGTIRRYHSAGHYIFGIVGEQRRNAVFLVGAENVNV